MRAVLVRKDVCKQEGRICDNAIYGDKDKRLKQHEVYRDEDGYIRNR